MASFVTWTGQDVAKGEKRERRSFCCWMLKPLALLAEVATSRTERWVPSAWLEPLCFSRRVLSFFWCVEDSKERKGKRGRRTEPQTEQVAHEEVQKVTSGKLTLLDCDKNGSELCK